MAWATSTDGVEIYYETSGPSTSASSNSATDVVVFVSGFFAITTIWDDVVKQLSKTHHCIALDTRGYGRSAKPIDVLAYSMKRYVRDVEAVLLAAGVPVDQKVTVACHSTGGMIANTLYFTNPSRVRAIVYISTCADAKFYETVNGSSQQLKDGVATPSKAPGFFMSFGMTSAIAIEAAKWPTCSLFANADVVAATVFGEERLSQIQVPALVIHGANDIVSPQEHFAAPLTKALPNATLELIEGVRHFPQVEAPNRTATLLRKFLVGLP